MYQPGKFLSAFEYEDGVDNGCNDDINQLIAHCRLERERRRRDWTNERFSVWKTIVETSSSSSSDTEDNYSTAETHRTLDTYPEPTNLMSVNGGSISDVSVGRKLQQMETSDLGTEKVERPTKVAKTEMSPASQHPRSLPGTTSKAATVLEPHDLRNKLNKLIAQNGTRGDVEATGEGMPNQVSKAEVTESGRAGQDHVSARQSQPLPESVGQAEKVKVARVASTGEKVVPESSAAAGATVPPRFRRPERYRTGGMFTNVEKIPTDPSIDPPPYACYNCWERGHVRHRCPQPVKGLFCNNCGRSGVSLLTCPRCSKAYDERIKSRQRESSLLVSGTERNSPKAGAEEKVVESSSEGKVAASAKSCPKRELDKAEVREQVEEVGTKSSSVNFQGSTSREGGERTGTDQAEVKREERYLQQQDDSVEKWESYWLGKMTRQTRECSPTTWEIVDEYMERWNRFVGTLRDHSLDKKTQTIEAVFDLLHFQRYCLAGVDQQKKM